MVLLGFQWADATLDKLNLFGNTVNLRAPLDVATPLWIAWIYFVVRAYQYYRQIPGEPIKTPFKERVQVEAGLVAKRIAAAELRHSIAPAYKAPSPVKFDLKSVYVVGYEPEYWLFSLHGSATVSDDARGATGSSMMLLESHPVRMPTSHLPRCRLRAAAWLTLHTPVVTEYVLPTLVASLPVLRWATGWLRYWIGR